MARVCSSKNIEILKKINVKKETNILRYEEYVSCMNETDLHLKRDKYNEVLWGGYD